MSALARRWLAAATLALAACAAPVTGEDLDARLREVGRSVHGLGGKLEVFPISADSQMAAWTLAVEAKETEPLPLARQLSRRMERAADRQLLLVAGGPYPSLTRRVVLDALALREGEALTGLVLVYVGNADSARDVRTAAAALDVRFVQRTLP
ncbi:MAG: hypothetical protein ACE5FL_13410 [Myxococcota bacterium]